MTHLITIILETGGGFVCKSGGGPKSIIIVPLKIAVTSSCSKRSIHYWLVMLEHFWLFPYIGNNHPNWLSNFQRDGSTTNRHYYGWCWLDPGWLLVKSCGKSGPIARWPFHLLSGSASEGGGTGRTPYGGYGRFTCFIFRQEGMVVLSFFLPGFLLFCFLSFVFSLFYFWLFHFCLLFFLCIFKTLMFPLHIFSIFFLSFQTYFTNIFCV